MEKDFYRDTWVRYLGYANELGESVRHLVDKKSSKGELCCGHGILFG